MGDSEGYTATLFILNILGAFSAWCIVGHLLYSHRSINSLLRDEISHFMFCIVLSINCFSVDVLIHQGLPWGMGSPLVIRRHTIPAHHPCLS